MAKRTKSKAITITAKDLSKKVETRANSARLAKTKPSPYPKSPNATELPVKRTTYGKGDTITTKQVKVGGMNLTRYSETKPKKK